MQGNLDNPPIIVRGSHWTALWMLIAAVVFVVGGIAMLRQPDPSRQSQELIAYAIIIFFGLGIPIFATRLLRPDNLEIAPSGLTWRNLIRTSSWRWRDVTNFRAYRPMRRSRGLHIGFDFAADFEPQQRGTRAATKTMTGVEGSVGGGWEIDAAELAALLNSARTRWINRPA